MGHFSPHFPSRLFEYIISRYIEYLGQYRVKQCLLISGVKIAHTPLTGQRDCGWEACRFESFCTTMAAGGSGRHGARSALDHGRVAADRGLRPRREREPRGVRRKFVRRCLKADDHARRFGCTTFGSASIEGRFCICFSVYLMVFEYICFFKLFE